MDEKISEVFGALVGDGCLSKYKSNNRTYYVTALTGNWFNDTQYYKEILQPIFIEKFNRKGYMYHRKDDNTIRYFAYGKKIFDFFKNCGMPQGLKKKIRISLDISNNQKNRISFVRGLFNTDGTVYSRYSKRYKGHKKHYKNYAVVQIKLNNLNIIQFLKYVLEDNKIKTTKIGIANNAYLCRITAQKHVERFFKTFRINHKYHLDRYHKIRNL